MKIIWFQPRCHGQGHLPLDQVAQSPIQPGVEQFNGWGIHSLSGQPVPVPHHPQSEEFLPYISSKSTLFRFKAITPCPITMCPCKKSISSFLVGPLHVLEGCCKVSPEPSLLQAELSLSTSYWHCNSSFNPDKHRILYSRASEIMFW